MNIFRWIAAVALLLTGSLLLSINISKPLIGQHDWNGVVYGQAAKNFVRFGYLPLRFGATISSGDHPVEDLKFLTHYPPTLPMLMSLSYRIFGVREWSTRLVPVIASISSMCFIVLLGSKLVSWRVGFLAGSLSILTPMFIYYGKNPVHEVVQLPFSLLAFYSYLRWQTELSKSWRAALFTSLVVAMLVGWEGYYAAVLIALHGLLFGKQKRTALVILAFPLVLFAFYIFHVSLVAPGNVMKVFTSALARTGSSGVSATAWIQREARYAVNLLTGTLLGLSGVWAVLTLRKGLRLSRQDALLVFLALYGVTHAVLFRDASWFHEYLLFPVLPFLAISSAIIVNAVLMRLKPELMGAAVVAVVLLFVGWERAGYAKALLTSEYARRDYEEALQFVRNHEGQNMRIPEERDVYFVFYADRLD